MPPPASGPDRDRGNGRGRLARRRRVRAASSARAPRRRRRRRVLPPPRSDDAALGLAGRDTAAVVRRLEQAVRTTPATGAARHGSGSLPAALAGDRRRVVPPRSEAALRRALAARPTTIRPRRSASARSRSSVTTSAAHSSRPPARVELAPFSAHPPTGSSATHCSSSGATPRRSRRSRRWSRSSRPSRGTRESRTPASSTGDRSGAIAAMRLALESTGGVPEPTAWTLVELAKLEFGSGHFGAAERALNDALRVFPGYVHSPASSSRASTPPRAASDKAIAEARTASAAIPLPGTVALLGDLLERVGDRRGARRQFATVGAIQRLLAASGVQVDLDDRALPCRPRASHPARPWRSRDALAPIGPRSRVTTRSAGRSPGRASATRRSGRSTARCGSARATHSSTSTAATPPAVRGDKPAERALVSPGARAESEVLGPVGARGEEGALVRKLRSSLCAVVVVLVAPGPGRGAPARQLHRQPLRRDRARRGHGLRPLRARPRRDPDLPGRRQGTERRRSPGASRARSSCASTASGSRSTLSTSRTSTRPGAGWT